MRVLSPKISLMHLLCFVAACAIVTTCLLNWRDWYRDYQDWSSTRAVRASAQRLYRAEIGADPPVDLVYMFGSGSLSHWGRIHDVALTQDQIISCGADNAVRCWSTESGDEIQLIAGVRGYVCGAGSQALVAAIDQQEVLTVYDTVSVPLKKQRSFSVRGSSPIQEAYPSNVSPQLAISYMDDATHLAIIDVAIGKLSCALDLETEADRRVGFREDGKLLIAERGRMRLFDTSTGECLHDWIPDPWPLEGIALRAVARMDPPWWLIVSATGQHMWHEVSGEWKPVKLIVEGGTPDLVRPMSRGTVRLINDRLMQSVSVAQDEPHVRLSGILPSVNARCFAEHTSLGGGQYFTRYVMAGPSSQLELVDEYEQVRLPDRDEDHITAVAWSSQSDLLAAGTACGEVILMRSGSWGVRNRFRAHGSAVEFLEFSPDGNHLLVQEQHQLAVFNWLNGMPYVRKSHQVYHSFLGTLSQGNNQLLSWILNEGWVLEDYVRGTLLASSSRQSIGMESRSAQNPIWLPTERRYVSPSEGGLRGLAITPSEAMVAPLPLEEPQIILEDEQTIAELSQGSVRDIDPDRSLCLFYERKGDVHQLHLKNWNKSETRTISCGDEYPAVATLSPLSERLATILANELVIFDFHGREVYRHPIGPAGMNVSAIEFSSDDRYLAVVCGNGLCLLFRHVVS